MCIICFCPIWWLNERRDVDKIVDLFSVEGVRAILETPLFGSIQEDKVLWQEKRNGLYSVKTGYRIAVWGIVPLYQYHVPGEWNKLWKVNAPHKARNLLWRICHGCVPTRAKLVQLHGSTTVWESWFLVSAARKVQTQQGGLQFCYGIFGPPVMTCFGTRSLRRHPT